MNDTPRIGNAFALVQIVLIALKLAGQLDWGWGSVLLPLWLWLGLNLMILILAILIAVFIGGD